LQQAPEPDKFRSLLCCSSKLSRSGAYYCNAVSRSQRSSRACCVTTASKQAPKPEILRSFVALQQQASSGASGACVPAPKLPELVAFQQQASFRSFRSLLRSSSKQAPEAPELAALHQQVSSEASGACCVPTASKLRKLSELTTFQQQASSGASGACVATQAPELSGAWSLLAEQQAPKFEACCSKLRTYPELGACCNKLRSFPKLGAC